MEDTDYRKNRLTAINRFDHITWNNFTSKVQEKQFISAYFNKYVKNKSYVSVVYSMFKRSDVW